MEIPSLILLLQLRPIERNDWLHRKAFPALLNVFVLKVSVTHSGVVPTGIIKIRQGSHSRVCSSILTLSANACVCIHFTGKAQFLED